jgi:NADH-quinone oxidoreductase subunit M
VDGISLTMVFLTAMLTPLCILASFSITDRVKSYMILFLLLETGMLGVFLALDLLVFFVFWEVGLGSHVLLDQPVGGQQPGLCFAKVYPVHHGRLSWAAAGYPDDWGCCWNL